MILVDGIKRGKRGDYINPTIVMTIRVFSKIGCILPTLIFKEKRKERKGKERSAFTPLYLSQILTCFFSCCLCGTGMAKTHIRDV